MEHTTDGPHFSTEIQSSCYFYNKHLVNHYYLIVLTRDQFHQITPNFTPVKTLWIQ